MWGHPVGIQKGFGEFSDRLFVLSPKAVRQTCTDVTLGEEARSNSKRPDADFPLLSVEVELETPLC